MESPLARAKKELAAKIRKYDRAVGSLLHGYKQIRRAKSKRTSSDSGTTEGLSDIVVSGGEVRKVP